MGALTEDVQGPVEYLAPGTWNDIHDHEGFSRGCGYLFDGYSERNIAFRPREPR